jgi:phosphopentomutase
LNFSRTIIIVLDGFGVGALPDAKEYGDLGANTLLHVAEAAGGISLPNFESLGLGNLGEFKGLAKRENCIGSYGRMTEQSTGKDSISGHWEIAGLRLDKPFPVYPRGFPPELMDEFRLRTGREALGNVAASGTEIIDRLGEAHLQTGRPIVYTSVDSVFQIAAHVDVIPLPELYEICSAAREMLCGAHAVGRVIARPFRGAPGRFRRTTDRKDFSIAPTGETLLDKAKAAGLPVVGIGKIEDLFAGRGLTEAVHTAGNTDGMARTLDAAKRVTHGIIFTNLVDFDMLYGHRNDAIGYYNALMEFDNWLPRMMGAMNYGDVLFITGDHGTDPGLSGTDHTREYVPLLVYGPGIKGGVNLGTRESFSDLGATVAEALKIKIGRGKSFLKSLPFSKKGNAKNF